MDKILFLCLVTASSSSAFGVGAANPNVPQNPYELELDRARSAWNFGGHYSRKAPWMISRPHHNIPGQVIADRRSFGGALPFQPAIPPVPLRQILNSPSIKPPQSLQYSVSVSSPKPPQSKPSSSKSKPKKSKRPTPKKSKPSKMISPRFQGLTLRRKPAVNRTSRSNTQTTQSKKKRASRRINSNANSNSNSNSRSDTVMNKFRKEDLWHLDKGESYALKNKDIEDDHHFREYGHNLEDHEHGDDEDEHENEIFEDDKKHKHNHNEDEKENDENDNEKKPIHKHIHEHDGDDDGDNEIQDEARVKIEEEAEKVVAESMKGQPHSSDSGSEGGKDVQHVHHHHHHHQQQQQKNATKEKKKEEKKPVKNQITPFPLPRIHNPIPLGCLLTWPVFHPIRPRHQLACLLSIPGTPNLHKRRRKRSADSQNQQQPQPQKQYQNQPQYQPNMGQQQQQPQSQQHQFYQHQNQNQGMSPYANTNAGLRKAYANHVGGNKSPMIPPPSSPINQNLKVAATIIPPPKFDKTDILQMLLGSGGVDVGEIGTVLMSNNRYVRYGRGFPNSSNRSGRTLWPSSSPRSPVPPRNSLQPAPAASSATASTIQPAQLGTHSIKQFSPMGKPSQTRSPVVSLTPPVKMAMQSSSTPSHSQYNIAASPSHPKPAAFQNHPQITQLKKPVSAFSTKIIPSTIIPILTPTKGETQKPFYNSDSKNFKYNEWKPVKSQQSPKSKPSFQIQTQSLTQPQQQQLSPNTLTAESQHHSNMVNSAATTTNSDHSSIVLTGNMDVSDLAEALGMYGSSSSTSGSKSKSKSKTKTKNKSKAKFEKPKKEQVKVTISKLPPPSQYKDSSLKSFSYAVKNKNENNRDNQHDYVNPFEDDFEDDNDNEGDGGDDDDASASNRDSNNLRFSLFNEYGDEELEVYVPKSKLRFSKVNKIPDPIFVSVPKDNSIDRI